MCKVYSKLKLSPRCVHGALLDGICERVFYVVSALVVFYCGMASSKDISEPCTFFGGANIDCYIHLVRHSSQIHDYVSYLKTRELKYSFLRTSRTAQARALPKKTQCSWKSRHGIPQLHCRETKTGLQTNFADPEGLLEQTCH